MGQHQFNSSVCDETFLYNVKNTVESGLLFPLQQVDGEELCRQISVVPAHLEDQSTDLKIVDFVE